MRKKKKKLFLILIYLRINEFWLSIPTYIKYSMYSYIIDISSMNQNLGLTFFFFQIFFFAFVKIHHF